ncbi:kelch-like protein 30 [Pecten maximus]|uniref:kelch-like protein 30 n=1 Tax=Pecten maximus TaxID=6579 RepID=UPI0014583A89|nr:kelch-like protein 30 [Pecten maximus]
MEVNNNSQAEDLEGNHPDNTNPTLTQAEDVDGNYADNINPTHVQIQAEDVEGNYPDNTNPTLTQAEDVDGNYADNINPTHVQIQAEDVEGNYPDLDNTNPTLTQAGDLEGNYPDNINPTLTQAGDLEGNYPDNINPTHVQIQAEDVEGNYPDNTNPTHVQIQAGDLEGNHQDNSNSSMNCSDNVNLTLTQAEDKEGRNTNYTPALILAKDVEGNPSENTNLTLIVGGEEMTCSRDKLSSNSDYFKAMFDSNMKESTSDCISLEQVDPEAMRIILDFLVTGRLDLTQDNVHIVTETACMFQIKLVIDLCCELMDDLLNDDNCLAILSLTHTFALEELFQKAKRHCLWYFSEIVPTSNFVDIDVDLLYEILLDRKLVVNSEMKVYDAIEKWVSHNISERKMHLEELFPLIRKEAFTEEEISMLRQKTMLQDYQHMFEKSDTSPSGKQKYRAVPYCLWSLGGQDDYDDIYASDDELDMEPPPKILKLSDIDTTCTFESIPMDEQDHPSVIQQETGYSVCVHGKDIYVSGGLTSLGPGRNSWLMDVWKLDTFTSVWENVTQLRSPRRHHTMICVGESLILIGGFGKYRMKLKTCEEFNMKTGEWKDLPPMPEESFLIAACATSSNRIYAFKSRAFYYDLGSSHWSKVASSVYSLKKLVPSTAVYIPSKDCVYIVSRYHKDLLCFNLATQTLTTVGQFQYGEAASNAVVYRDRVCRFTAPEVSPVLEWYDLVKEEFSCRSDPVDGISVLNFHLLPIPDMLEQ